jgi:hypothetical protein
MPLHFCTGAGKVPDDFPVIVTSYEIIIADAKFFQTKYRFKYVQLQGSQSFMI